MTPPLTKVIDSRVQHQMSWFGFKKENYFSKLIQPNRKSKITKGEAIQLLYKPEATCAIMEHPVRSWTIEYDSISALSP